MKGRRWALALDAGPEVLTQVSADLFGGEQFAFCEDLDFHLGKSVPDTTVEDFGT